MENYLRKFIYAKYSNGDGTFADGSQTSYVYALLLNLPNDRDETLRKLVCNIEDHNGQIRTGIFGTPIIYKILSQSGYAKIVWNWLNENKKHSLLGMLDDNNGTLKEQLFLPQASQNHAMFASYLEWCYECVLGLKKVVGDKDKYEIVLIDELPYLSRVSGNYQTDNGLINVHWKIKEGKRFETVVLPTNTTLVFKSSNLISRLISDSELQLNNDDCSITIKAQGSIYLQTDVKTARTTIISRP